MMTPKNSFVTTLATAYHIHGKAETVEKAVILAGNFANYLETLGAINWQQEADRQKAACEPAPETQSVVKPDYWKPTPGRSQWLRGLMTGSRSEDGLIIAGVSKLAEVYDDLELMMLCDTVANMTHPNYVIWLDSGTLPA